MDEQNESTVYDTSKGKPTQETRILVCQCGSAKFTEKKKTKTAIVFTCGNCGLETSVKGNVAIVRAAREEVSYAISAKVTSPKIEVPEAEVAPGEAPPEG